MIRRVTASVLVLLLSVASAEADPVFELGFSGPSSLGGTPGLTVQFPVTVRVATTPDAAIPDSGVQGWSLSIGGNCVDERRVDFEYNDNGQCTSVARFYDLTGGATYQGVPTAQILEALSPASGSNYLIR